MPCPFLGFGTKNVRYSSGHGRKRKDDLNICRLPLFRQGGATVGLMTRLIAEGSGRLHIYREVCGSNKGNVNQVGCLGYFLAEMAFVVGQGLISLLGRCRGWKVSGQGVISPRVMQPAWSIREGPKVQFCFLRC